MIIKWFRYDCRPGAPKPTYGYTWPDSKEVLVGELKEGDASKTLEFAAHVAIGMKGFSVTAKQIGDDVEITIRGTGRRTADIVIATVTQWRIEIIRAYSRLGLLPEHWRLKDS